MNRRRRALILGVIGLSVAGLGAGVALAASKSSPSRGTAVSGQTSAASYSYYSETGVLDAVACPSATLCLGVGYNPSGEVPGEGQAVPLDPATGEVASGQSVQTFSGFGALSGVACASATECLAVGSSLSGVGMAVPLDPATGEVVSGQSGQTFSTTSDLTGVACPSATECLAVGMNDVDVNGVGVPLDPATGAVGSGQSVQVYSDSDHMNGAGCLSQALCLGVGQEPTATSVIGDAMPLDPATGQEPSDQYIGGTYAAADVLNSVACARPPSASPSGTTARRV